MGRRNRTYTAAGLHCGTSYKFAIYAINDVGRSESSNVVEAKTNGSGLLINTNATWVSSRDFGIYHSLNLFIVLLKFIDCAILKKQGRILILEILFNKEYTTSFGNITDLLPLSDCSKILNYTSWTSSLDFGTLCIRLMSIVKHACTAI